MATKPASTRIKNKHDLEINWNQATNFTPLQGELIVYDPEIDSDGNILTKLVNGETVPLLPEGRTIPYTYARVKIGDGVTNVNSLPFIVEADFNNKIACGTSDPSEATQGQFYFKYSD